MSKLFQRNLFARGGLPIVPNFEHFTEGVSCLILES
jgi:hypothetical protein